MSLSLLFTVVAASAATPTLPPRQTDPLTSTMLAVHNAARAEVGAPPLVWDEHLARSAASYGPRLASLGRLVHSPRDTRPGQRENLARNIIQYATAENLAQLWVAEKQNFRPGVFPEVTRNGRRWEDVAHYTQMIWRGTTHVGCAVHDENGWRYLICRYSPPGNADGKAVP